MPVYPIRRRPRECKTCQQCRANKVRCDRNMPCSNCIKRDFNCTYGRPPPALPVVAKPSNTFEGDIPFASPTPKGSAPQFILPSSHTTGNHDVLSATDSPLDDSSSDMVSISHIEWEEINSRLRDMEQVIGSLKSLLRMHSTQLRCLPDPRSDAFAGGRDQSSSVQNSRYGSPTIRTGSIHIGSRSAFVDILAKSKNPSDPPREDLLTELALGNKTSSYPFVDLWSSDPVTFNIGGVCSVLPPDDQCLKLLNYYTSIGAVIHPVLSDIEQLEGDMRRLLDGRKQAGGVYRPDVNGIVRPFGMSISFLTLCFAVLASGCQLSDLPGIQREMTSWVYISCSYQCLRMLNYVAQPSVEIIQILLIINSVLSYNMNPGASYTLLGMTERMCMALGLHVETAGYSPAQQEVRRRVWWAMAFQNSHFSLAYDRPSITMISQPNIPYYRKSMPGYRSYFETLSRIMQVVLESLRNLMISQHVHLRPHEIQEYVHRIRDIKAETSPHLRYREHCTTLADNIERAELRLHSSYYVSVLCRVSLDPDIPMDARKRDHIRDECLTSLASTVEAFIDLHTVSKYASRTWISVQRAIASAFLLLTHISNQPQPQIWDLIERLETVLADHVYSDGTVNPQTRTDSAKHLSSSLEGLRAVTAAVRAGKGQETTATLNITPTQYLPSTEFTDPAVSTAPSYTGACGVRLKDKSIGNILNEVSDVMLFPSMSTGIP
ncbi:uncharacterized protein BJX67DRAFT_11605 [Aspergillus lucknowensis]|uniref:Zn(2)-C6 fungal-type domain-containing protein n=1 Tax=Aspergillus lucknowensis TaxID=176173 RepID=A0ABR4M7G8_9EURO